MADYVRGRRAACEATAANDETILLSGDQTLHHARVDGSGALGHHAQINTGDGPAHQGTQHFHVAVAAVHQHEAVLASRGGRCQQRRPVLLHFLASRLEDLLDLVRHDAPAHAAPHGSPEPRDLIGEGAARVDDEVPPWVGRKPATACWPL